MPAIRFATQSYKNDSLPVSAQQAVNCYTEKEPDDAAAPMPLYGIPGQTQFADTGVTQNRGAWEMGGVGYVVQGQSLYSVASDGTTALLGSGISGTNQCSLSDNGTELIVVNGVSGWIYSVSGGYQPIVSPNFYPASTVTFTDGYFLLPRDGTNQWFISGLYDGMTYSGLDFASAEVNPDWVKSIVMNNEQVFIFGQETTELWYSQGGVDAQGVVQFPFGRYAGGTIDRGLTAALATCNEDNTVFWLGDDKVFYRLQGIVPLRISTHAIEQAWSSYSTVSDAFCYSYTLGGHKFVLITFPTAQATWAYDVASGLWAERESWASDSTSYGLWRVTFCLSLYGKILIGDRFSGRIGYLDTTVFTEYGNPIRLLATSPPISSDRHNVFMSRFELYVESGVGLTTGQGSDPQVMFDWSDDGGRTFSTTQLWRTMGKIGAYLARLRWLRMGKFRQRVLRITITDPVKRTIISAHADLTVGSS